MDSERNHKLSRVAARFPSWRELDVLETYFFLGLNISQSASVIIWPR